MAAQWQATAQALQQSELPARLPMLDRHLCWASRSSSLLRIQKTRQAPYLSIQQLPNAHQKLSAGPSQTIV